MIREGRTITMSIEQYDALEQREQDFDQKMVHETQWLEKEKVKLKRNMEKNLVLIKIRRNHLYTEPDMEYRWVDQSEIAKMFKENYSTALTKMHKELTEKSAQNAYDLTRLKGMSIWEFLKWRRASENN